MEYKYLIEFIPSTDDNPYCAKGTFYDFDEELNVLVIYDLGISSAATEEEAVEGIRKRARFWEKEFRAMYAILEEQRELL